MSRKNLFLFAVIFSVAALVAQDSAPPNSNPSPMRPTRRGGAEPCWQVAGVQKSVIEQLWSIQHETHSQVENVCSNSSLTPQQKHQQVREIREHAHQKIESLITPDQQKALMACREQRGESHPGAGFGAPGGGCGEGPRSSTPPGSGASDAANRPGNPSAPSQPAPQN